MARQSVDDLYDFDRLSEWERFERDCAKCQGKCEVTIKPVKPRVSDQQRRWYFSQIVRYFADYLTAQDYEVTSKEAAHDILRAKFLTVSVTNKQTGEIIGSRVRSTTELTTAEAGDFYERCRVWLWDFFRIRVPDPDPNWRSANRIRQEEHQHV